MLTAKNIIPITSGDTILPKKIPNLNHSLFNGDKIFELIIPKIKNTKETLMTNTERHFLFKIGYKPINKKTTKKHIYQTSIRTYFNILTHLKNLYFIIVIRALIPSINLIFFPLYMIFQNIQLVPP